MSEKSLAATVVVLEEDEEEEEEVEEEEELEPLFNYPTVRPLDLLAFQDDRFDCSPPHPESKPQTTASGPFGAEEKEGEDRPEKKMRVDVRVDLEEDEDWLASPPPRVPSCGLVGKEDETLRKLRLQKQELISFTESTKEILQKVTANVREEISSSRKIAPEVVLDEQSKPQAERPKVVISIQDKDGAKQFRVYSDDKFEKLFKMYAQKAKLQLDRLIFTFDGDKVSPNATPEVIGMENDDILEVHMRSV